MKLSAQIPIFSQVSFIDKLLFTKHLSIMLKSGITIIEALHVLEKQTKSAIFRSVVGQIVTDIENGQSFAKALQKHPHVFNAFYINLIDIGEQAGKLDENLVYLANQLSKEYLFKQKVRGALAYPVIVLTAAVIVGLGISIFVLPKLIDLFKGFGTQLPLSTQLLLGFAMFMKDYNILVIIGIVLCGILFRFVLTAPKTKPVCDKLILLIPLFGNIIQNAILANLCRSLGVMLKSGLPITKALEIEKNVMTNAVYNSYIEQLLLAVVSGKSLTSELEKSVYKRIPLIAAKMISVGEETGKLDETLLYLGDFFEEEVDDATKNITTVLEPLLLLFIVLIVAFVALSIISPIYSLTSSIQK